MGKRSEEFERECLGQLTVAVHVHIMRRITNKFAGCASTSKIRTGYPLSTVGRDSSDGMATRYSLQGPGIESRWGGENFQHPSRPVLGPHPTYAVGTGSFPGVKWPGRGVDNPPAYSAEVKERVELYIYSTPGPSWPIIG